VHRESRYVQIIHQTDIVVPCLHSQTCSFTECVYASWEEYGSCAGYDYIMEKVVKTTSVAFHGAAIKGSCDDDQSKAISGKIKVS
jgi:hypothetical protein